MSAPVRLASLIDLNAPGRYLRWGVVQISVANAVVVALMALLFLLAILVPFPKGRDPR